MIRPGSLLSERPALIFGGAGFVGMHLVECLANKGMEVSVYDRNPPARSDITYIEGDFQDVQSVCQAIRGHGVVFHLISTTWPSTSNLDPGFDLESNVIPTIAMLETAVQENVSKVVFASSGGTVYGIPQYVPIPESHPTDPICSYGIGKLTIEKYLQLFRRLHGLDYAALRIANPYGPGQKAGRGQGVIAEFVSRAVSGQALEVYGDGSVIRDFLYISDAVNALVMAAEKPVSGVFNIGSGVGVSLRQLIETIGKAVGKNLLVNYGDARAFDVPSNVLCVEHARRILGWGPVVPLEDGIGSMVKSVCESGQRC